MNNIYLNNQIQDVEHINILTEMYIKDFGRMVKEMDQENTNGLMVQYIKVIIINLISIGNWKNGDIDGLGE